MNARKAFLGFTLVEMLVVLTLLSMVMLGLAGAMRSMAQVEMRVDSRLSRVEGFRVAVGFLRSTLERVSAKRIEGLQPGQSSLPFVGDASTMIWVGVMPARYGVGGRHFFRLSAEKNSADLSDLVIRYVPYTGGAGLPTWGQSASSVLVSNVNRVAIRYQDTRLPEMPWRTDWPFTDRLPQVVSVSVETPTQVWPDIITAMHVIPGPGDGSNVFVTGGGAGR